MSERKRERQREREILIDNNMQIRKTYSCVLKDNVSRYGYFTSDEKNVYQVLHYVIY